MGVIITNNTALELYSVKISLNFMSTFDFYQGPVTSVKFSIDVPTEFISRQLHNY